MVVPYIMCVENRSVVRKSFVTFTYISSTRTDRISARNSIFQHRSSVQIVRIVFERYKNFFWFWFKLVEFIFQKKLNSNYSSFFWSSDLRFLYRNLQHEYRTRHGWLLHKHSKNGEAGNWYQLNPEVDHCRRWKYSEHDLKITFCWILMFAFHF